MQCLDSAAPAPVPLAAAVDVHAGEEEGHFDRGGLGRIGAVYGDGSHRDVLMAAGVPESRVLIITADVPNIKEVIRLARDLNPKLRVLTRTAHLRDVDDLHAAGAHEVFSGEGEVALALTEAILQRLGATPEQMDRERIRVHDELFGT